MFNYKPGLSVSNRRNLTNLLSFILLLMNQVDATTNNTYSFSPDKCPDSMILAGDPYCEVPNSTRNYILFLLFFVILPFAVCGGCFWCCSKNNQSTSEEKRPIYEPTYSFGGGGGGG
jgi:hypothetical protein